MDSEFVLDSGECRLMAKQLKHIVLSALLTFASVVGATASSAAQDSAERPLPTRSGQYLSDAVKLARLLGRAHAIRVSCNGRSDQFWRLYMQEMLDLEAPEQGRLRQSMARAFNDAFSAESKLRQWCDDSAVAAEAQFAAEGRTIAERLAKYYFNR